MKIAEDPKALLNLMAQHELALARLYNAFAQKFTEFADFWADIADQEIQHAAWLEQLNDDLHHDSASIPEDIIVERFPAAAIETSLRFIDQLIEKTPNPDFLLINALSHAMHIEEALIENRYFEVLDTENPRTLMVLEKLKQQTNQHSQTIRNLWMKYK